MDKATIKNLIENYLKGTASPEETAILETWFIQQQAEALPTEAEMTADLDEVWLKLAQPVKTRRLWQRIAAAASIVLALSASGYFLLHETPERHIASLLKNDIKPGSEKATLILANGAHISLTTVKIGRITDYITKTEEGKLTYADTTTDAGINTLVVPAGGQYELTLPDGTRVWLNAASSLKYPASFRGLKARNVELTGEAYFEVAHNSALPFKVITNKQVVEDIGTHFNINAYGAAVKTTLTEGSVRINNSTILKPGQQAISIGSMLQVEQADIEEATAWKNGYFRFNNESIGSVMSKLAGWYDIEVVYEGQAPAFKFYGTIARGKNISQVLILLEQTKGVHFKIEGRRVIVLK